MPINRYDTISTATYNPRSLEETLMFPMLRRKQHDEANAKLESQLMALDKVDPLDVHYNQAQKIKSDLLKTIDTQSQKLATEGFNVNTTGDLFKTNRNIQELYSPTGTLGKINAAKIAQNEAYKRFLSSDDAKSNSSDVNLANWQKHLSKYKGYDPEGGITNIGDLGAVQYVDPNKFIDDLAKNAGFTDDSWKRSNSGLIDTGIPGENRYVVDRTRAGKSGSNIKNLEALATLLNQTITDPSSPLRKSINYTGRNPLDVYNQLNSQLGIYTKKSRETEDSQNISNVDWGKLEDQVDPNLNPYDAISVEAVPIYTNKELLNGLKGTSPKIDSGAFMSTAAAAHSDASPSNKLKTAEQTVQSPAYQRLASQLIRTNKSLSNLKPTDKRVIDAVTKYAEENEDVSIQNKYVDPFVKTNNLLFPNTNLGKNRKEASETLLLRARSGAAQIMDSKKNIINPEEVPIHSLSYAGDMTPESKIDVFKNPKQNIMAHRAVIRIKEDGEFKDKIVYISRDPKDFDSPQYKGGRLMHHVANIADNQPGIYHHINTIEGGELERSGKKNFEVKFNKNKRTYDINFDQYDPNTGKYIGRESFTNESKTDLQEFLINLSQ